MPSSTKHPRPTPAPEIQIKQEVIDVPMNDVDKAVKKTSHTTEANPLQVSRKEKAVDDGTVFLKRASDIIRPHTELFPEFQYWLTQCEEILTHANSPRVLVGVLGYTGSGKSSLINALIDEEMVVPTNAMRASTSVVTEISWNNSDEPNEAYKAEIEFINEPEWKAEIDILLDDVANGTRGEDLTKKSGTEASSAFAKITAVYPEVNMKKLPGLTTDALFGTRDLSSILGNITTVCDSNANTFSKAINAYIDTSNKEATNQSMDLWPLVRCVRIYVKSNILRHGLVLVDLPGLGDSNSGRTQVAEKYMKKLTYIWIVADIVRAIDDQVAKDLMGGSFRRQLLMDGKYDNKYVTFIMTKTDNINTNEVIDSLNLDKSILKEELSREARLLMEIDDALDNIASAVANKEKIRNDLEAIGTGLIAMASANAPLRLKRDLDLKKNHAIQNISNLKKNLSGLKTSLRSVRTKMQEVSTQERNKYTKRHLMMDFDNGLRELHQDLAQAYNQANPSHMNPVDLQNDTSSTLNIFCVSSRAYQRLSGRFMRDPIPRGFPTIGDTYIPDLQKYAASLTLAGRKKLADQFLASFNLFKLSVTSWAKSDLPIVTLSSAQKDEMNRMLAQSLDVLNESFSDVLGHTIEDISASVDSRIAPPLETCVQKSSDNAENAVKKILNSGISYQTFRAICKREGVFKSRKKTQYDWNEFFVEPFMETLALPWDDFFNQEMPRLHSIYQDRLINAVRIFSLKARELLRMISDKSPAEFSTKSPLLENVVQQKLSLGLLAAQGEGQTVHREIGPLIVHHVRPAYNLCIQERDLGAFSRMKIRLAEQILLKEQIMYAEPSSLLTERLKRIINNLRQALTMAHSSISAMLSHQIGDMIHAADFSKRDEAREKVRRALQLDLLKILTDSDDALAKCTSAAEDGHSHELSQNGESSRHATEVHVDDVCDDDGDWIMTDDDDDSTDSD